MIDAIKALEYACIRLCPSVYDSAMKNFSVSMRVLWNYFLMYAYAPEDCYSRIGAIHFQNGDYRKAISLFLKSEDSHGDRETTLTRYNSYYLGYAYWKLGGLREAAKHFESYFRLNKKDWQIASNIAWYYTLLRRNDTALEWHLRSLALEPMLVEPHVECARILAELGRADEALEHLDRSMELVETSLEKQIIESTGKKISGDLPAAVRMLQSAIAEPDSSWSSVKLIPKEDAYVLLAKFQRELGDADGALSTLEFAIRGKTDDPWLIDELVMEYADQGVRLEEALSLIEGVLTEQPENAIFMDTKGWVLLKLGRREEAAAFLKKCLELLPEYEDAREHLRHLQAMD
jgi:tetratricopeptide (TPR) repeat protein